MNIKAQAQGSPRNPPHPTWLYSFGFLFAFCFLL